MPARTSVSLTSSVCNYHHGPISTRQELALPNDDHNCLDGTRVDGLQAQMGPGRLWRHNKSKWLQARHSSCRRVCRRPAGPLFAYILRIELGAGRILAPGSAICCGRHNNTHN